MGEDWGGDLVKEKPVDLMITGLLKTRQMSGSLMLIKIYGKKDKNPTCFVLRLATVSSTSDTEVNGY